MKNSQETKRSNLVKSGDIWQLGEHRLACGDCRDPKLIANLLNGEKIDSINVDVPYGVSYTQSKAGFSKVHKAKNISNDDIASEEDYAQFTYDWLTAVLPHLETKNSIYIFNSDRMVFALKVGMERAGVGFSQLLIWIKNHAVIGRKDYLLQHELIAYGWYGTHQFRKAKDKSVLFYPKSNKSTVHPTMKPVGLIRHLVLNSTKIGGVVYDGFLGSGTTLLACEQAGRKCIGMEMDPEYCQTTIERWQKLTGLTAVKVKDGKGQTHE
jgi:site-specific DNA-methyltransferase (adenine-specific)